MRLYRTATGRWAGTQADVGKGFTQVEVPTDKRGLLVFLNDLWALAAEPSIVVEQTEPAPSTDCPACHRSPAGARAIAESEDTQAIEAWILDRAKPGQIENLFAAIGVRFHELRRATEAGR